MWWYRLVGDEGEVLGVERYRAWARYQRIYEELGLTAENFVARVRAMLGR